MTESFRSMAVLGHHSLTNVDVGVAKHPVQGCLWTVGRCCPLVSSWTEMDRTHLRRYFPGCSEASDQLLSIRMPQKSIVLLMMTFQVPSPWCLQSTRAYLTE